MTWSEFQERESRPAGENEDAQISSQLQQPVRVGVSQAGGQRRLSSYVAHLYVDGGESWVVGSTKTADLLAHEQGHYDITGLCARDLVADLGRLRASNAPALERAVQDAIRNSQSLATRLSALYDTDTDHSRNRDRQARWDAHIRSSMQSGQRLTGGPP